MTGSSHPASLTIRRSAYVAALMVFVLAFTLACPQPANAAPVRYNVIDKTSRLNVTGPVFATCRITTTGGGCDIARGKSVDRTIGLDLGASRSVISAGLSISSAQGVKTTVSCQSPKLRAGQTWRARAVGTRHSYRVQKQVSYKPRVGRTRWRTEATSSKLTAFDPRANSISCGL